MLLRISKRIVSVWGKSEIIMTEYEEAYIYGVQLLLSTLINISCIALISTAAGYSYVWIPFLLGFIPIRITAGGYHAKTPLLCSIVFCGTYCIGFVMLEAINDTVLVPVCLLNSIMAVVVVYLYSPLPAHNKPLSQKEMERKRTLSISIVSVLFLAMVVSCSLKVGVGVMSYVSLGELSATIFCYVAKLMQRSSKIVH